MEEPYIKEPINKAFANTDLIDIGSLNEGTTGIVQKAFAEWNKYMFCYYPANKTIIPSAYTVRNMNIPDTITNTQDNAFLNNFIEKRKLAKMFNAIDNGCESVSEILSSDGIDVRAGHHCAQPLLTHLKVYNATRASFMFYNTEDEVRAFVKSAINVRRRMGYDE